MINFIVNMENHSDQRILRRLNNEINNKGLIHVLKKRI